MKKTSILLAVLCFVGTTRAFGQSLQGTTYAEAQRTRTGTLVYTYVTTPGFAMPASQGQEVEGLFVEVLDDFMEWVGRNKGINLTREVRVTGNASDFGNFITTMDNARGGVFGLGNITITPARSQKYAMSHSIIPNVSIMLSHSQTPTLQSLHQLSSTFAGYTCYVVAGTTNAARMYALREQYYPEMNIVEVNTSEETIERITQNPRAFTNIDFTYYISLNRRTLAVKRHPAGDNSEEQLGVMMPKSNDWAPLFNEFLDSGYLDSNEYRGHLTRHLHRDILAILDAL